MKKQSIFIYEISTCNRRKLDGKKLYSYFVKNGQKIVQNPREADIILLVTCAYSTGHAEVALQKIQQFSKYNAELIVTGCLPNIEPENLQKIFNGKTISTKDLEKIDALFPDYMVKFSEISDANILWENINEYSSVRSVKTIIDKSSGIQTVQKRMRGFLQRSLLQKKSLNYHDYITNYLSVKYLKEKWDPRLQLPKDAYFIKSSEGCLGNCSYCVIKKAIGSLRSKSLDTIVTEFTEGVKQGHRNFVFDADDVGAYGIDIGSNFPKLLDNITTIPGEYKIYIRNIHPIWVVKYIDPLEKLLKREKIRGIGCSIQSGNQRILHLMQRFSNTEQMKNVFHRLRVALPDILLATECINGFPTETGEEFEDTLKCIREVAFDLGYIYPFSSRPGSDADKLSPKVDTQEILLRMSYAKKFLGKIGYHTSYLKHHKILFFSKASPILKLDDGVKAFCISTID